MLPFDDAYSVYALPYILSLLGQVPHFVWPYGMLLIGHRYGVEWLIQAAYLAAIVCAVFH